MKTPPAKVSIKLIPLNSGIINSPGLDSKFTRDFTNITWLPLSLPALRECGRYVLSYLTEVKYLWKNVIKLVFWFFFFFFN